MFFKKETQFMKVVVMVHMTKALVLEEGQNMHRGSQLTVTPGPGNLILSSDIPYV